MNEETGLCSEGIVTVDVPSAFKAEMSAAASYMCKEGEPNWVIDANAGFISVMDDLLKIEDVSVHLEGTYSGEGGKGGSYDNTTNVMTEMLSWTGSFDGLLDTSGRAIYLLHTRKIKFEAENRKKKYAFFSV